MKHWLLSTLIALVFFTTMALRAEAQALRMPSLLPFRHQPRELVETEEEQEWSRAHWAGRWSNRAAHRDGQGGVLSRIQPQPRSYFSGSGRSIGRWTNNAAQSLQNATQDTWDGISHSIARPPWVGEQPPPMAPPPEPPLTRASDASRVPRVRY